MINDTKLMRAVAFSVGVALLPICVNADDLDAFVGYWAIVGQTCDDAIEITEEAIATQSSYCEITDRQLDFALGTARLELACHHEGDIYRQPVLLVAGGDLDRMWRFYGGTSLIEMSRCASAGLR